MVSLLSHPFRVFLVESIGALIGLGGQIFVQGSHVNLTRQDHLTLTTTTSPPLHHHYLLGPLFFCLPVFWRGIHFSVGHRLVTSDLSRGNVVLPVTC
jgi:hypothetical protein